MSEPRVTVRDLFKARERLRTHLSPTPLRESAWLSSETKASVLLKLESLQLTNSFKVRGALNAVDRLCRESGSRTVVTASAGNHGRGMALAGERLGVQTVVFTPATAPATKKAAIVRHGADLRDEAADYDTAERSARACADALGAPFISPYNHPDVIAGAGTVGLEILDAAQEVDLVVVPVGGGGLISGIAMALKHAAPRVHIVGVEVEASTPFATSLARGVITAIDVRPSLADGLIGNLEPETMTFDLVRRYVDRLVSVSEDSLRRAIRGLAEEEHLMVEGAGAAATAAVLAHGLVSPNTRAVVLVTGGNIDLATFVNACSL
jgi:threonine dehydratase